MYYLGKGQPRFISVSCSSNGSKSEEDKEAPQKMTDCDFLAMSDDRMGDLFIDDISNDDKNPAKHCRK